MSGPRLKVAVLFGGASAERDVSIASGAQVIDALRSRGHQVLAIDAAFGLLTREQEVVRLTTEIAVLPPHTPLRCVTRRPYGVVLSTPELAEVDVVFVALHGGCSEDGRLQAVLGLAGP